MRVLITGGTGIISTAIRLYSHGRFSAYGTKGGRLVRDEFQL